MGIKQLDKSPTRTSSDQAEPKIKIFNMKIALATTLAIVAAKDKKVPPRHPTQRLAKLGTFYENFFDEMVEKGIMKQGEADRRNERAQNFLTQMQNSFDRENCGYYDVTSKHGGPDPNPDQKENGKDRNRRTADNEEDLTEAAHGWCADEAADNYMVQGNYSQENFVVCCQLDAKYCNGKAVPRSGAANQKAYDRLSDITSLKWRQITTGTRKWAERYINNCSGMRKGKKASKRSRRMHKVVAEKYFD